MKIIFTLLFLASCQQHKEIKVHTYTNLQKQYLASLPLEGQVFMEGCLNQWSNMNGQIFNFCLRDYKKLGVPVNSTGPGIGTIAAGTALGVIGAKVLTGSGKK